MLVSDSYSKDLGVMALVSLLLLFAPSGVKIVTGNEVGKKTVDRWGRVCVLPGMLRLLQYKLCFEFPLK